MSLSEQHRRASVWSWSWRDSSLLPALAILAWLLVAAVAQTPTPAAAAAGGHRCRDRYGAARNPNNPLLLARAPGRADPLRGARFFVDGPRHGGAAGAIARLLGIDAGTPAGRPLPAFSDSDTWRRFARTLDRRLHGASRGVAYRVRMLEKIASEPEVQRISAYSQGGSPAGVYAQTTKLFCQNFRADPGAVPIINTYFLHATLKGCPSPGAIAAYRSSFEAQIDALAGAVGRRPVVLLLELDAIGSSACIARTGGLPAWESMLRFEATRLGALPHAVVYLEGGYSDANDAAYAARVLKASGIHGIEGFFTNDTHNNWAIDEIRYARRISRLTGGAHFVVNTAQSGNGPKRNPHPVTQGIEDLCNPPGRALGPPPESDTGIAGLDALLWTSVPGNSSGCGGGPPGGVFWAPRAIGLAARANDRLGPGYPSHRY